MLFQNGREGQSSGTKHHAAVVRARVPSPRPLRSAAQPRRCPRVAPNMLRAADRLAVRVPQMPGLRRLDDAAHELAVDPLGAPASGTASTARQTRRHHRGPPSPSTAMGRGCVLRPVGAQPHERLTPRRAVALMLRNRDVFTPSHIAATDAEAGRNSSPKPRQTTCLAPTAQGLISMRRAKRARIALTSLQHEEPLPKVSGREKLSAAVTIALVSKKAT
jgi:hypothetical protein